MNFLGFEVCFRKLCKFEHTASLDASHYDLGLSWQYWGVSSKIADAEMELLLSRSCLVL